MTHGFLVSDADNTLWNTDKVFAGAQLLVLEKVEKITGRTADRKNRLAFVRQFDQEIAQRHEAGLRYPPILLIDAITTALTSSSIASHHTNDIIEAYFAALAQKPKLRPGVRTTLRSLQDSDVTIVVASEGKEERLRGNLDSHNLTGLVSDLVVGKKNRDFFDVLYQRGGTAYPKVCVGDQLDRDIAPAKEAGFTTLYFPGGFRPSWEFELGTPDADRIIHSYADVSDAFVLRNAA